MAGQHRPHRKAVARFDSVSVERGKRKKADRIKQIRSAFFSGSEVSQALAQICGLVSQASHRLSQ